MMMNLPFLHFDDVKEDSNTEYFEYENYDGTDDYVTDNFIVDERGEVENEGILNS